ncbi:MAG: SGNH/GDSL hydrolase family protein [Hyphomicrobiaceae bacterium]|nr:SGNH/GDSL hydrolase family protein [Hyphomicrobiaceae bacterium]
MSFSIKEALGNLALLAGSLAVTFAVVEFVIFGFVLPPDDLLENVTINEVVRYKPGQQAVFRHPDGRETLLSINAQGWNSPKAAYDTERRPGVARVAVVGDSYVHGAFVDLADSFPEVLERRLIGKGINAEVYRFGMDGAPLSQYLHMLRREVVAYKPDLVVVPLIHNDFDESYRFLKTRYASAFMKLDRAEDGSVVEIAPAAFEPGTADKLRRFATFRYVYYETGLYLNAKSLVSRLFWGGEEEWDESQIQSAVDIRKISDHDANRLFTRYVMTEMKRLAQAEGFQLLFVMDGVREAVYAGKPQSAYEVGKLNAIAAEVAGEVGVPFVDLYDAFAADWRTRQRRLEFAYDWHWNRPGNAIVAETVLKSILGAPDRLGLPVTGASSANAGGPADGGEAVIARP